MNTIENNLNKNTNNMEEKTMKEEKKDLTKEEINEIKELFEANVFDEKFLKEALTSNDFKKVLEAAKQTTKQDSKQEKEQEQEQNNENDYSIDELFEEAANLVDIALKDNPLLRHILNHSYDIAQAYTVLNFDNAIKSEYELDKKYKDNECNNIADYFYNVSDVNDSLTYTIIRALIVAIIEDDWCFIANTYNGNVDFIAAESYLLDKARISLDRKAFWKESENS